MKAIPRISAFPTCAATYLTLAALACSLFALGCNDSPSRPGLARQPESFSGAGEPTDPDGPIITLSSNVAGPWMSGVAADPAEIFALQGIRFWWSAVPGPNGAAIVGFSYAVDDTSTWPSFLPIDEWPPQPIGQEVFWFPDPGSHRFFLRAIDEDGFVGLVVAEILVFAGPQFCPVENRSILVVLDPAPGLRTERPADASGRARDRVSEWFGGWNYQIFETGGTTPPPVSLMDCASSIFWFHTVDVATGDASALLTYHAALPNAVAGYRQSGGNVFLGGLRPSQAMRYLVPAAGGPPVHQDYPLDFEGAPESFLPHWLLSAGVGRIEGTVGDPAHAPGQFAIKRATSIVGGANPYPDLPAGPGVVPPIAPGFGYFDWGITPAAGGGGEVIYEADDTGIGVGMRRLTQPGVAGNFVYVGFHPWFVDPAAFGDLVEAVLHDFGEVPVP